MTRPRVVDPADLELFGRQEAALLRWMEEVRGKQRLFAERERVFAGTRLALGGPRGRRVLPPAASPASEHSPQRLGVTGQALAARSLATPLLARPPAASLSSLSALPRHSGYTSHLGSTEATAPEAQLFTPAASSSRRKRRTRRHNTDHFEQLLVVSSSDCFSHSSSDSSLKTNNRLISDSWGVSLLDDDVDWEDFFCSAPPKTVKLKTVNSGGRKTRTIPDKPVSITHPVNISTPITQPFPASTAAQIRSYSSTVSPSQVKTAKAQPVPTTPPQMARAQPATTPVPAPRTRAAVTQSTSTPTPVSRVGVTGVQPPPVPVPVPRLRAARTQPDLPRGLEQLTSTPATSPRHPPPDPAFHALALSLVRLAEVSPAQAPALLAQAVALSPSLVQSLAQPVATPTSAQSLASPTSVHPLASPVQSVHSPAVQPPAQSVQSPVAQSPPVLRSPVAQSPPILRSPVAQSPPVLRSPVAQSPPVLQFPVAQSPPVLQSPPAQSPVAQSPALQSAALQSAPAQSVQSAPAQSVQSPPAQSVQSPPAQSVQSVAQLPVAQSLVLPPPVVQSVQSSVVQSLIHHPFQFPDLQPQHPEPAGFPHPLARPLLSQGFPHPLARPLLSQGFPHPLARPLLSQGFPHPLARPVSSQRLPRPLALPVSSQRLPRLLARPFSSQRFPRLLARPVSSQRLPRLLVLQLLFRHCRLPCHRLVQPQPQLQLLLRLVQLLPLHQPRLVLRLPRRRPSHVLDVIAGVVDHRTCSVAAAVFLAAAHRTCSVAAAVFLAAAHRNCLISATGHFSQSASQPVQSSPVSQLVQSPSQSFQFTFCSSILPTIKHHYPAPVMSGLEPDPAVIGQEAGLNIVALSVSSCWGQRREGLPVAVKVCFEDIHQLIMDCLGLLPENHHHCSGRAKLGWRADPFHVPGNCTRWRTNVYNLVQGKKTLKCGTS
ncbi:hypothetical protein ACER0C_005204 [Sarotherodon galilaeus]